jgi:hypothetical protein
MAELLDMAARENALSAEAFALGASAFVLWCVFVAVRAELRGGFGFESAGQAAFALAARVLWIWDEVVSLLV